MPNAVCTTCIGLNPFENREGFEHIMHTLESIAANVLIPLRTGKGSNRRRWRNRRRCMGLNPFENREGFEQAEVTTGGFNKS